MAKKPKKAGPKPAKSKAKKVKGKSPKGKNLKTKTPKAKTKARRPQRTETVLPKDLEARLMALAAQMDKTMDALLLQALCEFADAWEDHYRTINVLADEDERVQIVVKPE
ncbi:MAG: hypothetical protein JNM81_12735 [Rhodospirillaceae bacterium]|nr:hypothetical protein [Rhodospirillaceae bacterium]